MYSLAIVGAYMLLHTASLFLTLFGLISIGLSFPLAYFLYTSAATVSKPLSVLSVVSIFVIMGIAVDDVFFFIDMFR